MPRQSSLPVYKVSDKQEDHRERRGDINFTLAYDCITETLMVNIIQVERNKSENTGHTVISVQGRGLAACDRNGLSDPYVVISIIPDKKSSLQTMIKKKTLNPEWNEVFQFEGV